MWDGLLILLLLCIVMAIASFLSGMLPLYFTLSSRQLRLISALGTGVLVGTALIIIIPEGVETLYSVSGSGGHNHAGRDLSRWTPMDLSSSFKHDTWRREAQYDEDNTLPVDMGWGYDDGGRHAHLLEYVTEAQELKNAPRQNEDDDDNNDTNEEDGDPQDSEDTPDSHSRDPHAYIGVSLITGFILMYLIDTLPRNLLPRSSAPQRTHISLNNLSFHNNADSPSAPSPSLAGPSDSSSSLANQAFTSPTTTGLVIHALADGIALGASSTSTTSRLTFIIFIALILHKAPAAFGLSAVLLKQNLSKRTARAHLLVFSLSAPAGALLTWAAAHILGFASATDGAGGVPEFFTGVLLLFSGGTFLYVAVHALQENGAGGGDGHQHEVQANGYRGVPMSDMYAETAGVGMGGANGAQVGVKSGGRGGGGMMELGVTVVGMLVPLLINFGHGH